MKVPNSDPSEIIVTRSVPELPQSTAPAPLPVFPFLAPPEPATPRGVRLMSGLAVRELGRL